MENDKSLKLTAEQQETIENFIRAGMDIERQRVIKLINKIETKTISVPKLKKMIED